MYEDYKKGMVHETSIVSSNATIGKNVEIGPYAVIGDDVQIGNGCKIGPSVVIDGFTKIGKYNRFYSEGLIGSKGNYLSLGDNNIFREFVTINSTENKAGGVTTIGNNNLFQAYSHISVDCIIGNNVTIGNMTYLGNFIVIEDRATISALREIDDHVKIGKMVMVGGKGKVKENIPPFFLADGKIAKVISTNVVGLKRNGITPIVRAELKKAYKILYRSNLNISQALEEVEQKLTMFPEVEYLVNFMRIHQFR